MLSKANEPTTELKRYLESVKDGEATKIPQKDEKPKKETPKNTETSTYDYSDDKNADDKEW